MMYGTFLKVSEIAKELNPHNYIHIRLKKRLQKLAQYKDCEIIGDFTTR